MHFYEWNIGEYAKKTKHLTNEEDIAYRRALDMYYDTEKPLETQNIPALSRRLMVSEDALKNVINEFFPDGINQHAEEKIAAYYAFIDKQKANGSKGGRPKRTQAFPKPNPKKPKPKPLLTNNYLPLTTEQSKSKSLSAQNAQTSKKGTRLTSDWVLSKSLGDWALAEKPHLTADNIRRMAESFRDYWIAKPGKDGVKLDWEATWRNWVRKDTTDWQKSTQGGSNQTVSPVKHICEIENCGKEANTKTSKGHRCVAHIAK